ncbi:MAG: LysM peptidoglycan-binding domain-containing protein [Bacteroidetes bacterium]|nr:LysM peptidoglycan-binding domain-containing protein [Bacteroidota bacterium]MDA1119093.1 LysM peptidoglycan-binding domain-containing protein [Bacteroidota bacterium]
MKETVIYCALFLILVMNYTVSAADYDSIRVEIRNGQKVVIHEVEAKETLFALSRRYQVTVNLINSSNPQLVDGLKIGQQLIIPIINDLPEIQTRRQTHFVDIGETLFSISRKFGVGVNDIQVWNNLESVDLIVGQELFISIPEKTESNSNSQVEFNDDNNTSQHHIVTEKETLFAVSQKYGMSVDELKQMNSLSGNEISVGQKLVIKKPIVKTKTEIEAVNNLLSPDTDAIEAKTNPTVVEESKEVIPIKAKDVNQFNTRVIKDGELEKVVEEGLAKVIENTTDTKKYLALHRTAEIGTVMQVINMANNMNIYVRIVGKLPDTGENDAVLIKISRTAFEKFRAVDNQFPVQIIYIP